MSDNNRLKQDFAWYVISLKKFKLEEQLYFAEKVNIMYVQRIQDGLNLSVKYIKGNNLNQLIKRNEFFGHFTSKREYSFHVSVEG